MTAPSIASITPSTSNAAKLDLEASPTACIVDSQSVKSAEKGGLASIRPGIALLSTLFGMFPFLKKLYADSAYQGPLFHTALASLLPNLETEIVKRSDAAKGFVALPKRWIVKRSIGWLNRCRRLAKDWESLNFSAFIFLRLASIRLMLRKLCN